MQYNILKDSNITKIYLNYTNAGQKYNLPVVLKFLDTKQAYFMADVSLDFPKPKKKLDAELHVFTADGVYKSQVKFLDSSLSLHNIVFEVTLPKSWIYIQLRNSTRKIIELPVKIKFNDDFEIKTTTFDVSLGGISFVSSEEINSIYKKISGILTLELPNNTIINFTNGHMVAEARYVREAKKTIDNRDVKLYIYRFLNISRDDENVLKNFLIKID